MTAPLPADSDGLDALLLDYRSLIADLVQDKHDRGISTEELIAIDNKAKAKLQAIIAEAERNQMYRTTIKLLERLIQLSQGSGLISQQELKEQLEAVASEITGEPMEVQLKDAADGRGEMK